MDQRLIGFFDSGIGGLTSIPYLMKKLPNERIVYFGDTARTPYGSKAVDTIRNFSFEIADFLVKQDVKMIGIVCNTISATCLPELRECFPEVPIVGIIEPAAKRIARVCTLDNRVGLIATKQTVRSGAYERLISAINPDVKVFSCACPALVPLIEEGIIANDIMDLTIRYYIEDFILDKRIDTLVLGCTHYPLIEDNIRRLFPDLRIINPSKEIVYAIDEELKARRLEADPAGEREQSVFYASDLSDNFVGMIEKIVKDEEADIKFKSMEL